MASSNASRFLTSGGDERALALKLFWGQVLTAYRLSTVFYDTAGSIISHKMIDSGKSWEFPILGDDPAPEYHIPGTELLGQTQGYSSGVITIDDILVGHRDVPIDQIKLSHWDTLAPFATAIGRGLAIRIDSLISQVAVMAARTAASAGYHNGGNRVFRQATGSDITAAYPATATGAANFRDDVSQLAQLMDEDNVPKTNRKLIVSPYMIRVLTKDAGNSLTPFSGPSLLFSRDFTGTESNNANLRRVAVLEGFDLLVSNNMPTGNITTNGPPSNTTKYNVDCRYGNLSAGLLGKPAAIALCGAEEGTAAIGMVEANGITPHVEPDERRNTVFMKAQTFFGLGVLSPWCAGVIEAGNI